MIFCFFYLVCSTIVIRAISDLNGLRDCRVFEGSVSIVLLDDLSEEASHNISFPNLIEITGFLLLYRISGIKNLYHLFPNLAVIRGRDIFIDYSLIIYELEDLEEIGMINLMSIERGNVRIEKNNKLCYADKIDWTLIAGTGEHYISVTFLK
jgi:insulin receptor